MSNSSEGRQYVALTTEGSGWWVQLMGEPGEPQAEVERRALAQLLERVGGDVTDIYYDTWRKNLTVLSRSAARRAFPKAWRFYMDVDVYRAMSSR